MRLDSDKRLVIVGPRSALATHVVELRDVNWIGDGDLPALAADGLDLAVRLRSTRPPVPAKLRIKGNTFCVELLQGEDGVSPGQACVFYESIEPRARVLGGGFIKATRNTPESQASAA